MPLFGRKKRRGRPPEDPLPTPVAFPYTDSHRLTDAVARGGGGRAYCGGCGKNFPADNMVYGRPSATPLQSADHYCRVCARSLNVMTERVP